MQDPDNAPPAPKAGDNPYDVGERAETERQDFGWALRQMRAGKRVTRQGWNGRGMFCFLVKGSRFAVSRAPLNEFYEEGTVVDYRPHIDMKYVDGTIGVWVASHSDMLSEDWQVVA